MIVCVVLSGVQVGWESCGEDVRGVSVDVYSLESHAIVPAVV